MPGRQRVLIVARHPSAAGGAIALARTARTIGVTVDVLAADAAWPIVRESGIRSHQYSGPDRIPCAAWKSPRAATRQVENMASWLRALLERLHPDVVILTDASAQIGPDQVLAVAASRLSIPTARVRDAWGTATGLETRAMRDAVPADLQREAMATAYLEIDELGARLSRRQLGIPRERQVVMNGLYTLDRWVGRATRSRRLRARRAVGVGPDTPLVVYFTQPTRRECAERDAFDAFVDGMHAAGLAERGVVLATQEHPREGDAADGRRGLHWTWRRACARYRGPVINLTGRVLVERSLPFEHTMLAADVFASSYSNSSIEATALGASAAAGLPASERPIGFHTLCPAEVRQTMRRTRAGMTSMPYSDVGAMPAVRRVDDIGPLLSRLITKPATRQPFFTAMRDRRHLGRTAARVLATALSLTN